MEGKSTLSADFDPDLKSVQEARRLLVACRQAQREFALASQETVDRVCQAMADAAFAAAESLGTHGARGDRVWRWRCTNG